MLPGKKFSQDPRLKFILYFKNQCAVGFLSSFPAHLRCNSRSGPESGGSLPHGHSQLAALPFIPSTACDRFARARHYFERNNGVCVFCQMLKDEAS